MKHPKMPPPSGNEDRLKTLYHYAEQIGLSPFDHPDRLARMGHKFNPEGQVVGLWRLCAVIVAKRKMQGLK